MKKVFGSGKAVIGLGIAVLVSILLASSIASSTGRSFFAVGLCGLGFLYSIFRYLFALWAYDEKGFEVKGIDVKKSYGWEEVTKISASYTRWSNVHFIPIRRTYQSCRAFTKDGFVLSLSGIGHDKEVLSDVVRLVRKNNPDAEIEPRIWRILGLEPENECPHCGCWTRNGKSFCGKCGKALEPGG